MTANNNYSCYLQELFIFSIALSRVGFSSLRNMTAV